MKLNSQLSEESSTITNSSGWKEYLEGIQITLLLSEKDKEMETP